jgi:hypothetical protein
MRISLGTESNVDVPSSPYLDRIQDLDDAWMSKCPQFLESVLGEREGSAVRGDVEGKYAAVGAVFL